MNLRPFGETGLLLPPVVFGTSCLGNLYVALPFERKVAIMREWFREVTPLVVADSAGKYGAGLALEVMGRGLADLGVDPTSIVISNKLGWRRVPLTGPEPTFEPGAWAELEHDAVQDLGYDGMVRCWEQGCALLGEGFAPQLVSVHDPDEYLAAAKSTTEREDRWHDVLEAYRALTDLKHAGRVAGVGVGAKDWTVIRELDRAVSLDWVMIANSMTLLAHPDELWDFMESLADRHVGIVNSALYHGGFLVGGDYFDYRRVDPGIASDRELLAWREEFDGLCTRFGVTPAHACTQFGLAAPGVQCVAVATSRPERVRTIVDTVREPLPGAFWRALHEAGLVRRDVSRTP